MYRFWSVLVGYIFGNFITAEAVTGRRGTKSAYEVGSGNPGMANMMRVYGFKAGILTLLGDILKTVIACALCRFVLFGGAGILNAAEAGQTAASAANGLSGNVTACAWAGLGVTLGHNFPALHAFRGGKGVATTCAAIFMIDPFRGIISMIAGMLVTFATKYLPIGAVVIPAVFTPLAWIRYGRETGGIAAALAIMMLIRHFSGLRNIPSGAERQVNVPGLIRQKLGH